MLIIHYLQTGVEGSKKGCNWYSDLLQLIGNIFRGPHLLDLKTVTSQVDITYSVIYAPLLR